MGGSYGDIHSALALLASLSPPRTPSEWQQRFTSWQSPSSETEAEKMAAAERRVRKALGSSTFLQNRNYEIIRQGSYRNNTNIRFDSDVDLCVCLTETYFYQGTAANDTPHRSEFNHGAVTFDYSEFKTDVAICLGSTFGWNAIHIGDKAIRLNKDDDEKVSVDVVPAYTLKRYGPRLPNGERGLPDTGIAFPTPDGKGLITNFPKQHYENGVAKNNASNYRYKWVVRILKRLKMEMLDSSTLLGNTYPDTPSYLIECLVYNCPNHLFGHALIYDDVVEVLRHLNQQLQKNALQQIYDEGGWCYWKEVNGIKNLFEAGQPWQWQDADAFIKSAISFMGI